MRGDTLVTGVTFLAHGVLLVFHILQLREVIVNYVTLFPSTILKFQFSAQLGAMQHLKDQLEQRTRMIEANIHRQQEELRKIQEQLQMVHGQGLQVRYYI